mmetsp:Transcript_27109/g.44053  ORF Transcript_27109/g.44053 Transcript_27109/m.44053 type:complete len:205 (-) Transcript_27109:637-1251(-)
MNMGTSNIMITKTPHLEYWACKDFSLLHPPSRILARIAPFLTAAAGIHVFNQIGKYSILSIGHPHIILTYTYHRNSLFQAYGSRRIPHTNITSESNPQAYASRHPHPRDHSHPPHRSYTPTTRHPRTPRSTAPSQSIPPKPATPHSISPTALPRISANNTDISHNKRTHRSAVWNVVSYPNTYRKWHARPRTLRRRAPRSSIME